MKKAVQKFVGDAIPDALKCGGAAYGILLVSPMNDRLMVNAASTKEVAAGIPEDLNYACRVAGEAIGCTVSRIATAAMMPEKRVSRNGKPNSVGLECHAPYE